MHKALALCFFLSIPPVPQPVYSGWWHMTGHNYGAPDKTLMVVKPCQPVYRHDQEKFKRFCNNSGRYLEKYGGNKFCLTTGLVTKEKCEDILKQNSRTKRVILRKIED